MYNVHVFTFYFSQTPKIRTSSPSNRTLLDSSPLLPQLSVIKTSPEPAIVGDELVKVSFVCVVLITHIKTCSMLLIIFPFSILMRLSFLLPQPKNCF